LKNAKIEVLKEINEEEIKRRRKILFPTKKVQTLTGSIVQVEMKGDKHTLQGKLESADEYLNLHLIDTYEIVDGVKARSLGSVILRGNNIIMLSPVGE
jgi:small nuclear ribonucleoprotein (snRNP)-like protein